MIAKIVKGTSFSGVVKYILDPESKPIYWQQMVYG